MTLNQLNGNPIRGVRLQEVPCYDMALRKDIPIHEGLAFSVRAEAHNVLNNVLYGAGPSTSLTAPTFGATLLRSGPITGSITIPHRPFRSAAEFLTNLFSTSCDPADFTSGLHVSQDGALRF